MSNWINITPSSGSGGGMITITASTIGEITRRVASVIASNNRYSVSAQTQVEQIGVMPNSISVQNLSWVSDVPSTGGTATKDNCSYTVIANYNSGITVDITSYVLVTGELNVPYNTTENRKYVGELVLTFYYGEVSTTASTSVYQAARNYYDEYLTFNILSGGTIKYYKSNRNVIANTIYYSLDGGNSWIRWVATTGVSQNSITVSEGDKLLLKGYDNTYYSKRGDVGFRGTAFFDVFGNVLSLCYGEDFRNSTSLPSGSERTFYRLFSNCSGLTSASKLKLPSNTTTLCYYCMFENCTSLTTPPELPATTLAEGCYTGMFWGCTSLTTAPELPSTSTNTIYEWGLGTYQLMFACCTSLTTPPELPATTLGIGCYVNMFAGCTSLTTAPLLQATTLNYSCYDGMFAGCTSLTSAPDLPATTLKTSCYSEMFRGCTSLNNIKCLATTLATDCTKNWVEGVSANGTFTKNSSMNSWSTGVNGIPNGWTIVNNT